MITIKLIKYPSNALDKILLLVLHCELSYSGVGMSLNDWFVIFVDDFVIAFICIRNPQINKAIHTY